MLVRNRRLCGIDYGSRADVIVRSGGKVLIWQKGHSGWGDLLHPSVYRPSELRLIDYDKEFPSESTTIFDGGRLSFDRILSYFDDIAKFFGVINNTAFSDAMAYALKKKCTLAIGDNNAEKPWAKHDIGIKFAC